MFKYKIRYLYTMQRSGFSLQEAEAIYSLAKSEWSSQNPEDSLVDFYEDLAECMFSCMFSWSKSKFGYDFWANIEKLAQSTGA